MKKLSLMAGVACLFAFSSGSIQAQIKLTTLFASNNGGSAGGAVYFDITVTNAVRISQFETNYSTTTAVGFKVYTTPKTYVGKEANKSAWKLVAQDDGKAIGAGNNGKTLINLASPFILTPGTYGMALESSGSGHRYTNGTTTNNKYKDANLALVLGAATNVAFSGTPFTPRIWNGTIIYTLGKGLFSNFSATPVSGKSPLTVKFTDTTYSSSPPIKTWAWDFDGDNKIDSTLQNPSFIYVATGWDKTFNVTLTTTDGSNPSSKLTKTAFITVNPSTALAVDFGAGSTNKSVPGPIKIPEANRLFTSTAIRGFYFQVPASTPVVITGLRVPNDAKLAQQAVALFTMTKKPPAFSGTYTVTKTDLRHFSTTAKANAIIQLSPPVVLKGGEWVGVLGAGYSGTGTSVSTGYGKPVGPFKTSVGGKPITIARLLMQGSPSPFITNKGLGPVSTEDAFDIGRVEIFVAGNVIVPLMTTVGRPTLGGTATIDLQGNIPGAQGGLLVMSTGRLPVPVPTVFGKLLITPNFFLSVFVPNGTGQIPLPIPNNSALTGLTLDFQSVVFNVTTNTFGMTNGTEWFLGK